MTVKDHLLQTCLPSSLAEEGANGTEQLHSISRSCFQLISLKALYLTLLFPGSGHRNIVNGVVEVGGATGEIIFVGQWDCDGQSVAFNEQLEEPKGSIGPDRAMNYIRPSFVAG
jgi:hypothetical protein